MVIKTDTDGYIVGYATLGGIEGGQEYGGEVPDGFYESCRKYRLSDGGLVFDDAKQAQEEERRQKAERISELKGLLAATDYIAAKISEGAATREEYAEKLAERQSWRDEINRLEKSL